LQPYAGDQAHLPFEIGEIEKAIYAKLVQKVGNRHHWEDWANDIAKIARTHIDRITAIVENPANKPERQAFETFVRELREDLNPSITDGEVIEMLAQHLITKPVFDALFADYSFAQHNPMSKAMQGVLDVLHEHGWTRRRTRCKGSTTASRFGRRASTVPAASRRSWWSCTTSLRQCFPAFARQTWHRLYAGGGGGFHHPKHRPSLANGVRADACSKGVHIIDPFTGTGTFITRLLQSGLIKPGELPHKYKYEIHANEIVLLAYYIAAINIEASYHGIVGDKYEPFEGICLTDTFQMYEKEDLVDALMWITAPGAGVRKNWTFRVIMGNPPYSVGSRQRQRQ
jgi:predicted helicase